MIKSIQGRIAVIAVVVISSLITMIPNFTEVGENWFFSKSKIKYGLDIQGGLHLVMGVDIQEVFTQSSNRLASTLQDYFKEENKAVKSVTVVPQKDAPPELSIQLLMPSDASAVKELLEKGYGQQLQVIDELNDSLVVRFLDAHVQLVNKRTLEQAIETIRNRIDEFGVSEPSITAQGSDRILIQLPGVKDATNAKELINKTAHLEFQLVSNKAPADILKMVEEAEKTGNYSVTSLPYSEYVKKLNVDLREKLPKNTELKFAKAENAASLTSGKIPYLLELATNLDGDKLKTASVGYDEYGAPIVHLAFNPMGAKEFADITGNNVNRQLAIVLDDVVYSAPNINERIGGGSAQITLGSSQDQQKTINEAQILSMALRAGALPAKLEQLEERTVGPTLGHDSIEAGKKAILIGGALILLFMLIYYKAFGLVANIALVINIFLILTLLTALDAVLTLPGIAGIALTIGMAVDANVIIFERIKEELARGQTLKKSVEDGFKHAFSAIFDANITTGVVCVILMYFGTGPVRGFAVTLLCGLVTSMFTAIFLSKTIFDILLVNFKVKKLSV